jgi:hypothetical protein
MTGAQPSRWSPARLVGACGATLRDAVAFWGSTRDERRRVFACDRHLPDADAALFRAVDVEAPAAIVFRWLCQLRAAPYSYDWIDNLGRRSPRVLTPGLDDLALGQRVMTFFTLVDFERDRQVTCVARSAMLGDIAVTYTVAAAGDGRSRIVVKLLVRHARSAVVRAVQRTLLPAGDLVMMRRQLLNLKALAERDARAALGSPASAV